MAGACLLASHRSRLLASMFFKTSSPWLRLRFESNRTRRPKRRGRRRRGTLQLCQSRPTSRDWVYFPLFLTPCLPQPVRSPARLPRVKVNRTKRHFKKAKQENTETQMATFRKTLAGDAAFSFTFLLFFLFLCPPFRHANNKGFIYLGVYRAFARTPLYFFLSIERTLLIAAGILFLGNVHTCTKTKKETLLH